MKSVTLLFLQKGFTFKLIFMCLVIPKNCPIHIANKDITVYKMVRPVSDIEVLSFYMGFSYLLGKLYETTLIKSDRNQNFDIYEKVFLFNLLGDFPQYTDRVEQGHHVTLFPERLIKDADMKQTYETGQGVIYSCTIPKGSKFYVGYTDLAVSNKIIINQIYKL